MTLPAATVAARPRRKPKPPTRTAADELRKRRYAVLVESGANRMGYKILDAVTHLYDVLIEFNDSYSAADIEAAMRVEGLLDPDGGSDHMDEQFDDLASDVAGLLWVCGVFRPLIEGALCRRPADFLDDAEDATGRKAVRS